MVDALLQDARYGLRFLRRNPGFAAIVILSLALGSGAATAFFQLIDAIQLRPLPVAAPDRLVELRLSDMTHARGTWLRQNAVTHPLWQEMRQHRRPFADMFAWADEALEVTSSGGSRRVSALWVSGEFFDALGVHPMFGRVLGRGDDYRGCGPHASAVISHAFWRQEFGGDPAAIGRSLGAGARVIQIVGITPPGFSGLEVGRSFDIAMPICAAAAWHGTNARLDSGNLWWLTVMARLKEGVSISEAAAAVAASAPAIFKATLPAAYPAASVKPYLDMKIATWPAERGLSRVRDQYGSALALLFAIATFVLLVACANVAHLMLARAAARQRELGVRIALGASRGRLARQALVESLVVAAIGVGAGLLISRLLGGLIVSYLSTDGAAVFLDRSFGARTFAFVALLTIVATLVMAAVPVLRTARGHAAALTWNGRVTAGRTHAHARRALLAMQIAIALVLLSGTLLFARSLRNLQTVDAGFQPHGVLIADINFADLRLPADRSVTFHEEILVRVRATASVGAAAEVVIAPLTGGNWNGKAWMGSSRPENARVVYRNMVGSDYFRTLGANLVAGREFDVRDMAASSAKVAIVSEALVPRDRPAQDLIGEQLWMEQSAFEPRTAYQIIGVVRDTKYRDLREPFTPIMFMPLSNAALRRPAAQLLIRSASSPDSTAAAVRASLGSLSQLMRPSFRVLDTVARDSLLRERLLALVSGPFGLLALVLTALGLYGVISHTVAQRTREIGIRVALGANRRHVIMPVMLEAASVVGVGLLGGTLLTLAAGRGAATLLFGISSYDPMSLGIAAATLVLVAAGASYLPALRAARVDPIIALRAE